jgi:hypothetical protein
VVELDLCLLDTSATLAVVACLALYFVKSCSERYGVLSKRNRPRETCNGVVALVVAMLLIVYWSVGLLDDGRSSLLSLRFSLLLVCLCDEMTSTLYCPLLHKLTEQVENGNRTCWKQDGYKLRSEGQTSPKMKDHCPIR